jgi:hypothetical protein
MFLWVNAEEVKLHSEFPARSQAVFPSEKASLNTAVMNEVLTAAEMAMGAPRSENGGTPISSPLEKTLRSCSGWLSLLSLRA